MLYPTSHTLPYPTALGGSARIFWVLGGMLFSGRVRLYPTLPYPAAGFRRFGGYSFFGWAGPYPTLKKYPTRMGCGEAVLGGIVSGRRRGPGFGAGSAKVTGKLSAGIPGLLQHFDSSSHLKVLKVLK